MLWSKIFYHSELELSHRLKNFINFFRDETLANQAREGRDPITDIIITVHRHHLNFTQAHLPNTTAHLPSFHLHNIMDHLLNILDLP